MKYRRFGTTELTVSEVGFGCARLGGIFQSGTTTDRIRTLHAALDSGITFFDTADLYCQGESEELLGQAFRGRREKVIIATKVGYCLPARRQAAARIKPLLRPLIRCLGLKRRHLPPGMGGSLSQDFSADYILKAVDRSLKRLGTDYLDLYQLHSPPTAVLERGEFVDSLERLKSLGKIRYYGVSCETTNDALVCLRYPGISSLQVRLSLLDQSVLDEIVPRASERRIPIIARECYAGGLLARPLPTLNLEEAGVAAIERERKRQELIDYHAIAKSEGGSLAQVALQFVLGLDGICVTLLGMRSDEHLITNLRHLNGTPLTLDAVRALRSRGTIMM